MNKITNKMKILKVAIRSIKENKNNIKIISYLFILGLILGILYHYMLPQEIMEYLKEIVLNLETSSAIEISIFIMLNNIKVALYSMILGIFLGIVPMLGALTNGFVIGSIIRKTVQQTSMLTLWRLFPHGIFEIPAILIAFSFGLRLGKSWIKKNKENMFKISKKGLLDAIIESINVFIIIILPLLIIAGIIEGILFGIK